MKKLIGFVALLLLGSGLVTVATASPTQAACPYTNCIATQTYIAGPAVVKAKRRAPYRYFVRVKPNQGNARPTGTLYIKFRGAGVRVDRYYGRYSGERIAISVRFPKPGRVRINAHYGANGRYRNSNAVKFVSVRR